MKSRIRKRIDEIEKAGPPSTRGDLLRLRALLEDDHWQVRQAAAEVLGHSGKKACLPVLVQALRDPHHRVRTAAAQSLGWIKDPRAVPYLVHVALTDPDSDAGLSAILALQWIDDINAAPGLFRVIDQHIDPVIRRSAMGALVHFGRKLETFLYRVIQEGKRSYRLIATEVLNRINEQESGGPAEPAKPVAKIPYAEPTRLHMPKLDDEELGASKQSE